MKLSLFQNLVSEGILDEEQLAECQALERETGQPLDRINRDTDRDFYLNAQEAIEYGLADKIVEKI